MKERVMIVCPGRGTYNAAELGYLQRHHQGGGDAALRLDAMRKNMEQTTITQLDGADTFSSSTHMTGDNASLLIYACALADYAAIDRSRYEIVCVTGNSMGWYLALACAGILEFEAGARLVNNMGILMHEKGVGGQIVWSMLDDDWHIDPAKQALVGTLLEEAEKQKIAVHISIRLGGMVVFAADVDGLKWLMEKLPKDDRFPMRLNYHAAFHSPLLDHIIPMAQSRNSVEDFGLGEIPAIDGQGRIWSPKAFDPGEIYNYTLGNQINQSYDFSRAVQVAAFEFMPDKIIVLGPGTTMGAPVAQALIESRWKALSGKADFLSRQGKEPVIVSMGMAEQRKSVIPY